MNKKESFKIWLAYFCVCFFWGTTYFGIKYALIYTTPDVLFCSRQITAGIILFFISYIINKDKLPQIHEMKKIVITSLLLVVGANLIMGLSLMYIPSGLAALVGSFMPFYILAINYLAGVKTNTSYITWIGLSLGLAGLLLIFYDSFALITEGTYALGLFFIFLSNLSWAAGTVYAKAHKVEASLLMGTSLQLILGGLAALPIVLILGSHETTRYTFELGMIFIYMVIFGSIIGYVSFVYVVQKMPPAIMSLYAYINPIVAIILGSLFLQESFTWYTLAAIVLVLGGVFIVNYDNMRHEAKP
ncbi:MAG: EamA family transporter [Cytophagales bacterium]|nr:EamA family transporter [Cytophagales bacterium]